MFDSIHQWYHILELVPTTAIAGNLTKLCDSNNNHIKIFQKHAKKKLSPLLANWSHVNQIPFLMLLACHVIIKKGFSWRTHNDIIGITSDVVQGCDISIAYALGILQNYNGPATNINWPNHYDISLGFFSTLSYMFTAVHTPGNMHSFCSYCSDMAITSVQIRYLI